MLPAFHQRGNAAESVYMSIKSCLFITATMTVANLGEVSVNRVVGPFSTSEDDGSTKSARETALDYAEKHLTGADDTVNWIVFDIVEPSIEDDDEAAQTINPAAPLAASQPQQGD